MNDLDTRTLRAALRGPLDPPGAPVDVAQIMARGRRLRSRRRLAAVIGGLGAVAVLVAVSAGVAQLTAASPPAQVQPASPATHRAARPPASSPSPLPSRLPPRVPSRTAMPKPSGAVPTPTGLDQKKSPRPAPGSASSSGVGAVSKSPPPNGSPTPSASSSPVRTSALPPSSPAAPSTT